MTSFPIRGVLVPLLTPFNDDMTVANDLYVDHAQRLLGQGCAGLVPFGTTGEALSVGIDERIDAIRALVNAGIDPALMIPGTGLSNVADTVRLSRACLDMGCAAVMTLPPFYYKGVSEAGLYRHFVQLVEAIGEDARIFLYHIPPIAIVGIPVTLAARLHAEFPGQIVGIAHRLPGFRAAARRGPRSRRTRLHLGDSQSQRRSHREAHRRLLRERHRTGA
jgi:4-hydroxy-tetrahydrodipicolinate synthase